MSQDFTFSLQRLLNTPLACTEAHAAMIVAAVHGRYGIASIRGKDFELGQGEMLALASNGRKQAVDRRGKRDGRIFHQNGSTAVIPIYGTLTKRTEAMDPESGQTGYDRIEQKVIAAVSDPDIKGIWMEHDSGGGEAAGMADLMDLIYSLRQSTGGPKPIYAIANDHAYSASYGLLSAADKSFVTRTGGAGSVGTLALVPNMQEKFAKEGVKIQVMRSGANKARVNPLEDMDEETVAKVQAELDTARDIFADGVARNIRQKGQSHEAVKKKVLETEGESYMGDQARTIGLVNEVASPLAAWVQLQQVISGR